MKKKGKKLKGVFIFVLAAIGFLCTIGPDYSQAQEITTQYATTGMSNEELLLDPLGNNLALEKADAINTFNQNINSGGEINGATTKDEYLTKYSELNEQQNQAWNKKYNFRPETNAVLAKNWEEFSKAFEDNGVSKITLTADINHQTAAHLNRTESLELDGGGFTLEMKNGSLNVQNLASLAAFTANFSDVPVFHIHDITVINNDGYGSVSGPWAFINGPRDMAMNDLRRGLWQYRLGNVYTPYTASTSGDNQRIGGRLFNANRAQISVWGYNIIVTAAENFYLGGIEYEPYTYYRGEIADRNYSTVWFIQPTGLTNDPDSTGSRVMEIGEGSFVYLHNTGTGRSYPGTYLNYDLLNVGKNATYNVNTPGSAVSFNIDNSRFVAQEGAKINLLTRADGYPTVAMGSSANSYAGGKDDPANISLEFKGNNQVFIVGSHSGNGTGTTSGVIGPVSRVNASANASFKITSPNTFDFRNINSRNRGVLGQDNTKPFTFSIVDSDISLWSIASDINGVPTHDFPNVGSFSITSDNINATGTSSNSGLQSTFTRSGFKRISGMNSAPVLEWEYVTDADLTQKGRVLLGYTATGGSDPFDENGDARITSVYADGLRQAQVDFIDTLSNTFLGYSENDNYVKWLPENHAISGFQVAGQNLSGTPAKVDYSSGTKVSYNPGNATTTTVLDVTPPEPMQLTTRKITNVDKELKATGLEAGAKVYLQVNDGAIEAAGTVATDGTWSYTLPNTLLIATKVRIYMEDSATLPSDFDQTGLTDTRPANGNRNPITAVNYRDATFPAATVYTVEEAVVDEVTVTKTVANDNGFSTVAPGDVLTFTMTVTNDEDEGSDILWSEVNLTDVLSTGLIFDKATADLKVNGVAIAADVYSYDENSRTLSVPLGDILPVTATEENKQKVSFKATVDRSALGSPIKNIAVASGKDAAKNPFSVSSSEVATPVVLDNTITVYFENLDKQTVHEPVVITKPIGTPVNLATDEDVKKAIATVVGKNYQIEKKPNPEIVTVSGNGDQATYIFDGILTIEEYPPVINFEAITYDSTIKRVDKADLGEKTLSIMDTRSKTKGGWTLIASLTSEMTNSETNSVITDALHYVTSNNQVEILSRDGSEVVVNSDGGSLEVSKNWGDSADSEGLKLVADPSKTTLSKIGDYSATITWTICAGPMPGS